MNLPVSRIDSALRVSFCRDNTAEEVEIFLNCLAEAMGSIARK
jgi:cysteine desulfurase